MTLTPTANTKAYDPAPASDALLDARRRCAPLDGFPAPIPQTLDDAYAVQRRSIARWDDRVVGFKVGGIPANYRKAYGGTWLAGPVFSRNVSYVAAGGEGFVSVYDGGFAAYEAEYVMQLSGLSTRRSPVDSLDDALAHVTAVHLGAEIASSPMALINDLGPGAIISDFGNNAGVVIGPEVPLGTLRRLGETEVSVHIDGALIGRKPADPGEGGPLGALRFLLDHVASTHDHFDYPDTAFLSSGAVTGVHSSQSGTSADIRFGELGGFTLKMVPRRPAD